MKMYLSLLLLLSGISLAGPTAYKGKVSMLTTNADGAFSGFSLSGMTKSTDQYHQVYSAGETPCDGKSAFGFFTNHDKTALTLLMYAQSQGQTVIVYTNGTCVPGNKYYNDVQFFRADPTP